MTQKNMEKQVWLVNTLRTHGKLTRKEINALWVDAGVGNKPEAKREFLRWRNAAEELCDVNIECEKKAPWRYYIDEPKHARTTQHLQENVLTLSCSFMAYKDLEKFVITEPIPGGDEYLPVLLKAIKWRYRVRFIYQGFDRSEGKEYEVEPMCMKLFKQRWYVLARAINEEQERVFSLDRIQDFEALTSQHYKIPTSFDPKKIFKDCYGVFIGEELDAECIRLKVSALQAKYMRSLPLHASQKEVERNKDFSIFEFFLRPYFDFRQVLLSYGSSVEVLAPEHFRNEMREELRKALGVYGA